MPLELTSFTGALRERHPNIESVIDRLADTFTGSLITSTPYTTDTGGTAYRIWLDNDQLYGWAIPLSDIYKED